MFKNFAERYGAEVLLIVILAVFVLVFAVVVAKFVMPHFKNLKVGSLKMTLGFYILTFFFFYLTLPYYVKINEAALPLYREGLAGLHTIVGAVVTNYFRNAPTPQELK